LLDEARWHRPEMSVCSWKWSRNGSINLRMKAFSAQAWLLPGCLDRPWGNLRIQVINLGYFELLRHSPWALVSYSNEFTASSWSTVMPIPRPDVVYELGMLLRGRRHAVPYFDRVSTVSTWPFNMRCGRDNLSCRLFSARSTWQPSWSLLGFWSSKQMMMRRAGSSHHGIPDPHLTWWCPYLPHRTDRTQMAPISVNQRRTCHSRSQNDIIWLLQFNDNKKGDWVQRGQKPIFPFNLSILNLQDELFYLNLTLIMFEQCDSLFFFICLSTQCMYGTGKHILEEPKQQYFFWLTIYAL
jgi:hypothetical protein